MKNINLALKTPYYDAIRRGAKTTEYRDMTPYYVGLFVDKTKYPNKSDEEIINLLHKGETLYPQKIDTITFFNQQRSMVVKVKGITTLPHHTTFAIKLGDVI